MKKSIHWDICLEQFGTIFRRLLCCAYLCWFRQVALLASQKLKALHVPSLYIYSSFFSVLHDLFFRFRGRAGTSTDGSALVGLTAPTPDAVQMRVSARVQGSVHVNYSLPLWTETERSNARLHITDWTIYRMKLLKDWIARSFPLTKAGRIHKKKTAGEQVANILALKTSTALRVI